MNHPIKTALLQAIGLAFNSDELDVSSVKECKQFAWGYALAQVPGSSIDGIADVWATLTA